MTQQLIGGKFSATYPDATAGALKPAVGYKLYTYLSGTTTNKTTWSDSGLTAANTNPVVLDARGEASVFLGTGAYTMTLKSATGSAIWTRDGIASPDVTSAAYTDLLRADLAAPTGAQSIGAKSALAGAVALTLQNVLDFNVHLLSFILPGYHAAILNGTSDYDVQPALQSLINTLSTEGGGIIGLPRGRLMIGNYVEMKSNVGLLGRGDCTIFRAMFATPINRMITSPAATLQTNISLRNFKLDRTAANTQHGIITGGIDGFHAEGVHVYGFGPGVMSGAFGVSPFDEFAQIQSINVTIKNCKITACNNFGIAFGNVKNGKIINNEFIDCYREAIGLEAWGDGTTMGGANPLLTLGVLESCTASGNTLYMDTRADNHFGGFVGPAMFMGGASSAGQCRNCHLVDNTVYITNTIAALNYKGIVVYGAATLATEGCIVAGNTVFGAPAEGMELGIAGYLTRNLLVYGNNFIGPNASSNSAASIRARSLTGSTVSGNKTVGTLHTYGLLDDTNCSGNEFLDNSSTGHVAGRSLVVGASTTVRDPTALISSPLGQVIADAVLLADDEVTTLQARGGSNRGIALVTANLGGVYAILVFNGGSAPVVVSKSIDVVVGATLPDTDNALNIYMVAGNKIGVKNRLGSSRTITVTTFTSQP